MSDEGYRCARCGGLFAYDPDWGDEDAANERAANGWGDVRDEDMTIVCDDCYKKMMRQRS